MESTRYRIARANTADVGHIVPLFEAYRSFFAESVDDTSRRFLEDRLEHEESVIFVAWTDAAAAGFIQLYPMWSSWYCQRVWFLSDLYVTEPARNRGIGGALVKRVIAFAKETNASSILVELPRSEPHLAEFYANLGFGRDQVFELARWRFS